MRQRSRLQGEFTTTRRNAGIRRRRVDGEPRCRVYFSSDVQLGQRVALIGIVEMQ
jgi:hypothetical protein